MLLLRLLAVIFEDVEIGFEASLGDSLLFFGETLDPGNWDPGEWAWLGMPGFTSLIALPDLWDPEAAPPDGQDYYRWGTPEVAGVDPDLYARARGR